MTNPNFVGGSQVVARWLPETAAYPFTVVADASRPTIPSGTPNYFGLSQIPQLSRQRNNSKRRAPGSPIPVANIKGAKIYMVDVALDLVDPTILMYCTRTSSGGFSGTTFKGMPQLCLFLDGDDTFSEGGLSRVIRYASCAQLGLSYPQGGGPLQATARFLGIWEDSTTALALSMSALDAAIRVAGEQLTWSHVSAISAVDSVGTSHPLRNIISALQFTLNNNLAPIDNHRPANAGPILGNTAWAIRAGDIEAAASISLQAEADPALIKSVLNSDEWGNVAAVASNSGITQDGTPKSLTSALTNALLGTDTWGGGDPRGLIMSNLPVSGDDLLFS